jgi:hypothetical protein
LFVLFVEKTGGGPPLPHTTTPDVAVGRCDAHLKSARRATRVGITVATERVVMEMSARDTFFFVKWKLKGRLAAGERKYFRD